MVIQTCSEIFSVLMQSEAHASFSSDAVSTHLKPSNVVDPCSLPDFHAVPSNDRTALPHQKQ